ncbi:MAG: beta-lactamase family protein [Bacteroidales bacterium]|nr:beta-lactamase family protein [Bacteroidales bacterium]MCF8333478.1 beta-lactamase family protein [Bacteroidales bacterium]
MKTTKLIFVLILFPALMQAQDKVAMLDSLFQTMHQRSQFNGNVLIAQQGKVLYQNSLGYAHRGKQIPLKENILFNTGSVSKAFTALAIQQLAEKDQLKLTDKVQKYLSDFPYSAVTVHHLLIHASGLPWEYQMPKDWDNSKMATNEEVLKNLYSKKPELEFIPGEQAKYSNLGYMVLAEIVEEVSGAGFETYLQQHIFEPAGMTRTAIYNAEEIKKVENVAKGYLFYPFTGRYEEAIKVDEFSSNYAISGLHGDGNVYSTAGDLFSFCKALKNEKLLPKPALKKALEKHISTGDQSGNSFGYGWTISGAPGKLVQRGGELPGYVSDIIWDVKNDKLLIYLMNDYLAYLSYNRQIFPAYAGVVYSNQLKIPKLLASVELSKIAVTSSLEEMKTKIREIKNNPELYQTDIGGLKFLVKKLQDLGKTQKADLMMRMFGSGR